METLHISSRLKKIAKYIAKGSYFADIGSDHAYLPTYVCLNDSTSKAIAGEVNQGPFQNAQDVVNMYDLTKQIDVRLGDGLDVLHTDLPDTLVIAGMRSEEHTSELQSRFDLVCRLLLEKTKNAYD